MKKKLALCISLLAGLALAMAPFPQGLKVIGGILFQERADHSQTPAAGFGEFWVRTDGKPMFTDESGTDIDLSAGGGGGGSGTVTSVGITPTDGLQVDSGSPVTTSGSIQLGVDAAAMRAHLNVEDGATAGGDPTYGSAGGASDNAVYVDADNQLGLGLTSPLSSIHIYDETLPPTITYQYFNEGDSGSAGPAFADLASDNSSVGTLAWTDLFGFEADDSEYIILNNAVPGGDNVTTHYLVITDFDLTLPEGAEILGVSFTINGSYQEDDTPHAMTDAYVRIVKGGTIQTAVNRASGTAWPQSTETTRTYGGSADMWGISLTEADVESSSFGVAFSFVLDDNDYIYIDYVTATVTYSTGTAGDHTWATGISLSDGAFVFRENATDHVSIAKSTGDTTFLGDVTAAAFIGDGSGLTGISATVSDGSVTNAKLANMAQATIKGRASGAGTGAPNDLTASQVRTILNVADGATANTGTVTSVAASGTDGLEVDSGSPVTTSGTITLGVNAASLYAHLVSTASTVTGASGDTLLISDSSAGGALAEMAITDLILAGASTDNRIPKRNGTAGQLEDSGISIDDSDNVSGMGTLNSHAIPSGSGAFVTTDAVQTLTNKDVAGRELTDSSTPVDVNATDYDQVVTVLAANTTFNAPTSPPRNGKRLLYMVKQAASGGPYTGTWNSVFRSPDSWGIASNAIPAVSATAGTWDYYLFIWNDDIDKWDLLATSAPLS